MILYYFSLKMEGNKIKSLAKSQYDTLLLADKTQTPLLTHIQPRCFLQDA